MSEDDDMLETMEEDEIRDALRDANARIAELEAEKKELYELRVTKVALTRDLNQLRVLYNGITESNANNYNRAEEALAQLKAQVATPTPVKMPTDECGDCECDMDLQWVCNSCGDRRDASCKFEDLIDDVNCQRNALPSGLVLTYDEIESMLQPLSDPETRLQQMLWRASVKEKLEQELARRRGSQK